MKNKLETVGILLCVLIVIFLLLSVFSFDDVQGQYDGYPPPGYPVPTDIGYPAPLSTEVSGYPAPVPSDPPNPTPGQPPMVYYTSDAKGGEQISDLSPIQKLKETTETVTQFIKINRPIKIIKVHKFIKHMKVNEFVEYYGKIRFEIR